MTKIPSACLLLLFTGCAPNTAALIDDAMETGDWRAVNARLDAEAERDERHEPMCRSGHSALCVSDFGNVECRCVESAAVRYRLGNLVR